MSRKNYQLVSLFFFLFALVPLWFVLSKKIDVEHGFALVAAMMGFAGTVWIAAGVWMREDERRALNELPNRSPKLRRLMAGFFIEADRPLWLGTIGLLVGLLFQMCSVLVGAFHFA